MKSLFSRQHIFSIYSVWNRRVMLLNVGINCKHHEMPLLCQAWAQRIPQFILKSHANLPLQTRRRFTGIWRLHVVNGRTRDVSGANKSPCQNTPAWGMLCLTTVHLSLLFMQHSVYCQILRKSSNTAFFELWVLEAGAWSQTWMSREHQCAHETQWHFWSSVGAGPAISLTWLACGFHS